MLPNEIKISVEAALTDLFGHQVNVVGCASLGGGCINEAQLINTSEGRFFIKYNSATAYPQMFEREAEGLKILSGTHTLSTPEVITYSKSGKYVYLLLQYIEGGAKGNHFWYNFGSGLADLHKTTSDKFGLPHDNYIGSLMQSNEPDSDFIQFFITRRLQPQLKMARDKGFFNQTALQHFEFLFKILHNIIPIEKPALVHGDLWSGNFIVSHNGSPCLIDPAIYFGHREADISMSRLFVGFGADFYSSYHEHWPLEKGWQQRTDIFNLYPLLVHVNLFGGGYQQQVMQIVKQF